jgi:small basic protein (TIGR04137 family)
MSDKGKKQRSVLKRTERLKHMIDHGTWKQGDDIFGLPKIKTVALKIKKEKAAAAPAAGTEVAAAAPGAATAAAAAPAAKAAGKPAATKAAEKK